ncbi:hypothetical protein OUZ56_021516 [Daphnia magna]|uniref:Uncharacterized protein n=1 Tax=Daphnia magna TaxID=35525 RepID=A0ABQ9ZHK4_9CRUS|nr:hypothetical protein OUZ56_021516 [Daphnia magna]
MFSRTEPESGKNFSNKTTSCSRKHACGTGVVDPTMAEATKVDYLLGGLRPSLVEKLYPLQPKTGEEFLEAVKRFTDAKLLANR